MKAQRLAPKPQDNLSLLVPRMPVPILDILILQCKMSMSTTAKTRLAHIVAF
jgi:hypothetical protein